jgi:hypothetical protein
MSDTEEFFFCLNHHRVEQRNQGCAAKDRLGPYPSEAEASRALEKVQERNREWDEDPRWNDKS